MAPVRPPARLVAALPRRLAALLGVCALSIPAAANPAQAARPDQVLWRNATGRTTTDTGEIKEVSLDKVVIAGPRGEKRIDASNVQRIVFGEVPPSYTEGQAYFDRRDFENAAKTFQVAAGDASARPFVKAHARLSAARAFLRHGATDRAAFALAKQELDRFLADHADNRDVPAARLLLGRAQRLSGDASAAAATYAELYAEGKDGEPTAGYQLETCLRAGLGAAEAYLAAGDVKAARETYTSLERAVTAGLAALDERAPERQAFILMQNEARLGEGFCLLANGDTSQAKTFFSGQLSGANGNAPLRYGAKLGLAEALLAEGKARDAQLEFAQVSAIDHTDRDRVARALVGLAECSLKLAYANAEADAKRWLRTVREHYGDTPSVLKAQELSQSF